MKPIKFYCARTGITALSVSVFVCGAVVMIFELVGSRIMAPYFGISIYVWTSIIGVILGSLSVGYWLGGRLADKHLDPERYSAIIYFSSLSVLWAFLVKDAVPSFFAIGPLPIEVRTLIASLIVFTPTSVLLGMVSPYAVRLKLSCLERSGSTVGNLYAVSTAGSILGTFLAGYFLIPFFGTADLILVLAAVLAALSLCFTKKFLALKSIVAIVLIVTAFLLNWAKVLGERAAGMIRVESQYNEISVYPSVQQSSGRDILNMGFDDLTPQASMFTSGDDGLVWDYTKYYRLAGHFDPSPRRALMIGGGAYSYPKDFLKNNLGAALDVVELDPAVTEAAKKYFNLKDDPRLTIKTEDARTFLNGNRTRYDAIFDDAFNSSLMTPFDLSTKEAVARRYAALNDGGVVIANIIGSIDGPDGRFVRAEYATYKTVFPQVYIFPVSRPDSPEILQNIMLVAIKSDRPAVFTDANPELNGYLQHRWTKPVAEDAPVLTDDFAPVEYYMRGALNEFTSGEYSS
jgi:spermidine synthase